ncbi:hypothetical protein KM043_004207 [Ampulex compressa]|nr:hypothetical protein KM043_004207 [Ampulex compressa]
MGGRASKVRYFQRASSPSAGPAEGPKKIAGKDGEPYPFSRRSLLSLALYSAISNRSVVRPPCNIDGARGLAGLVGLEAAPRLLRADETALHYYVGSAQDEFLIIVPNLPGRVLGAGASPFAQPVETMRETERRNAGDGSVHEAFRPSNNTLGGWKRGAPTGGLPERDASLAANYRGAGTIMEIRLKLSICEPLWGCLAF